MCTVINQLIRYEIQGYIDRKQAVDVYRIVHKFRPSAHSLGMSQWADEVAREAIEHRCNVLWEPLEDMAPTPVASTVAPKDESSSIDALVEARPCHFRGPIHAAA